MHSAFDSAFRRVVAQFSASKEGVLDQLGRPAAH